jgi:uncharacterized OB-fold protein
MAQPAIQPATERMLPKVTDTNRPYWTGGADGQLHVQFCEDCSRWLLPAVETCPGCNGVPQFRPVSGDGSVFTYTTNHQPFHPNIPPPNLIAVVTLAEQEDLRVITNLINCTEEDISVGTSVQVRFEDHGEVFYPVFEPTGQRP